MYDTSGTYSVCDGRTFDWRHTHARLSWLSAEIAREETARTLARARGDEEQAFLIARPVPTQKAFALFGALLGLLPPAAIFSRMFETLLWRDAPDPALLFLCVLMNVVCFVFGRAMGGHLGRRFDALEARPSGYVFLASLFLGAVWGLTTGALGGLVFFGVGAFVGALVAVPVGMLGFAAFTLLHRLLARGGMIEARQLWPLAFGVPCALAALILGH